MAKFKVGDRVKAKDPIWGYRKGTVKEIIDDPALKKAYTIDFDDGMSYAVAADAVSASNSAVRSTNSAVQEALNSACARNGDWTSLYDEESRLEREIAKRLNVKLDDVSVGMDGKAISIGIAGEDKSIDDKVKGVVRGLYGNITSWQGKFDPFQGEYAIQAKVTKPIGTNALNSACARNAAYPKTIDLSAGNWEATLMPRTDYLLLEKGDIRTKDYTALEGTVAEVTRKIYSSVKGVTGKDLADAKAIVAKANAEMVKYEKDERSHGRGTNSACATNSAEVEVSLQYAARVQQAMRDAVRMVSGVRQSSTNTLYCPDDDAAEEVVEILTDAGVPKNEVCIHARKVRNDAGANDPKNTEAVKKMWNDFKKRLDAMRREADTLDKKAVAMKVYGVRWDNVTRKLEDAVGLMEGWN